MSIGTGRCCVRCATYFAPAARRSEAVKRPLPVENKLRRPPPVNLGAKSGMTKSGPAIDLRGHEMTTETITVCDHCLRASCWRGEFMCDEAREAGTVEKTWGELIDLDLEHSSYWLKLISVAQL